MDPLDLFSYDIGSFDRQCLYQILKWFGIFWILLEIGFYVALRFVIWPSLRTLNRPAPYHHTSDAVKHVFRIFDHIKLLPDYEFRSFLSGFFREANPDHLKRENVQSFLSWVMYSAFFKDLGDDERSSIELVIDAMGREFGFYPPDGFNPEIKHVAMTLEPVPFLHRPLLAYVGNGIAEMLFQHTYLRLHGFNHFQYDKLSYWVRQGPSISNDASTTPLLVLHGITNGWITYSYLLHSLLSDSSPSRTIILVDVDAIKIKSLCFDMFSPDEFPECIAKMLSKHGIPKVSVLGHSFGSITAGWIVLSRPDLVSHMTLVDPVSLLLGLPEVAYNFLYRPPSNMIEGFILYGASREITISHMLHRHFWWHRNILYLEDVPHDIGVVVALSSDDPILNASAVLQYSNHCNSIREQHHNQQRSIRASGSVRVLRSMTRGKTGLEFPRDDPSSVAKVPLSRSTSCSSIASSGSASPVCREARDLGPAISFETSQIPMKPIVPVFWSGYTHGQFLMCGSAMPQLLNAMHSSEGLSKHSKCL